VCFDRKPTSPPAQKEIANPRQGDDRQNTKGYGGTKMCLTAVPTPGCTTPLPNSVREGAGTGGSSTTRAFLDFHTGADHIMIDIAPNATISRGPAVWLPSPDPLPRISPLRSAERRTVAESWRLGTIWTRPRLTSASLLSVINATPLGRWECTDMLPRAFPQPHQRCGE
jgi:hypothetical protein